MNITTDVAEGRQPDSGRGSKEVVTRSLDGVLLGSVSSLGMRNRVFARVFGGEPEPMRIGRYRVLERVGSGAMGVVYAAYDNQLDRKIAVKLIHRSQSHGDENAQTRLLREAQALARLSHPNVVQVHDAGDWDRRVFVAMEFIRGKTLREWVTANTPDWRTIVHVFVAAGRGLAAAHAAGIVHRDFKPDNVLVAEDGSVKVVDFGLANAEGEPHPMSELEVRATSEERALTETGMVMGTPAYMAPEQFSGERADARADQFAFCVALYETLWGKRPFSGTDFDALARSAAEGPADPPRDAVPARVRAAIRRGLSADRAARFESIEDLLGELERSLVSYRWWLVLGALLLSAVGFAAYAWIDHARGEGERSAALAEEVEKERARATELEGALAEHRFDPQLDELERLRGQDPTRALIELRSLEPRVLETRRGRALLAGLFTEWTAHRVEALPPNAAVVASTTHLAVVDTAEERWVTSTGQRQNHILPRGKVTVPRFGDCIVTRTKRAQGGEINLWQAPAFEPVLLGYSDAARHIVIADGCSVVGFYDRGRAATYDVASGQWSVHPANGYVIQAMVPSSRPNRFVMIVDDGELVVVDGDRELRPVGQPVGERIRWSPDGDALAAITRSGRLFTMSLGKYPWHQLSQYGEFADVQFGPKGKLFCSRMNLAGEAVVTVSRDFDIGFLSIPLPAGRADQLQIGPAGRFVVARDERTKDVYLLDVEVGMVHSMVGSTPPTAVLFAEPGFISMTNEHARHWNEPPAPARGGPEKSRMIAAYRTDSRGWFLLGTEGGFWRSVPGGSVELDVGLRRPDSTWQEYNRRLVDVSRDGSLLALARADGLSIVDDEGQRNIDVEGGVPAVAIAPNGRELAYWGLGSVFVVELGDDGSISSPRSVCSDCPIAVRRGFGWFEGRPWAVAEKGCSIYLMDMGQGVEIIDSPLELCSGVDVAHGVAAWRGRNADDERPKLVARRLDSGREFETVARPGEEFGLYVAVADAERVLFSVGPRVLLWEFEDTDERFDRDLVTREVLRTRDEITSIQRQADDSLTVMDGLHRVWEVPLQTDEERIAQLDSAVEVVDVEHP